MDYNTLSQTFGGLALIFKFGESYLQTRFPDSKTIRLIRIPNMAFSSLSHYLRGETAGAIGYAIGTARSATRATKLGEKYKEGVALTSLTAFTIMSAATYEEPIDIIPLVATLPTTAADYTGQGRYQRLFISKAAAIMLIYSASKGNLAMTANLLFTMSAGIWGAYKYDFKNAAGTENASLKDNLKAYIYGLVKNAPTGADPAGQVNTGEGTGTIEEKFIKLLEEKENPYFIGQRTLNIPGKHL